MSPATTIVVAFVILFNTFNAFIAFKSGRYGFAMLYATLAAVIFGQLIAVAAR